MHSEYINLISYTQAALVMSIFGLAFFTSQKKETYIWFVVAGSALDVLWLFIAYNGFAVISNELAVRSAYYLVSLYVLLSTYYYAIERHYLVFFAVVYILFAFTITLDCLNLQVCPLPENLTRGLYSIIAALISIMYFYILIIKSPAVLLYLLPFFWFNAGIFFYHAGNLWVLTITQNWSATGDTLGVHQMMDTLTAVVRQIMVLLCIGLHVKPLNLFGNTK